MAEISFKRKPLQVKEVMDLIDNIPNDWMCITTDLHASTKEIKLGKVAIGEIYEVKGRSINEDCMFSDGNDYAPKFCPRFHRILSEEKHFCGCHENLLKKNFEEQAKQEKLSSLIRQTKKPCGVFLYNARGFSPNHGLTELKEFIKDYLSEKYFIRDYLKVLSGIDINQRGVTTGDGAYYLNNSLKQPDIFNSQEYFSLFFNRPGYIEASVGWNPDKNGKEENVKGLVDILDKLKFNVKNFHLS